MDLVMKGRNIRIVNPVRFFIAIFICVFSLTLATYSLFIGSSAQASSVNTFKQVVVQDNGSLWAVAEEYCESNMDIRDYIDDICEINDIDSNDVLQQGDILFVPIYS